MVLSHEAREIIDGFNWQAINWAMLHPSDIKRLENLFSTILDSGFDYEVNDIKEWIEVFLLGTEREAEEHILAIAKEIRLNHT